MANLTKCAICDSTYSYCPNCATTHAWKFYTDTHECFQIFMIIKQYKTGLMLKDEAKQSLEYLGFTLASDFSKFKPDVADKIKEILTVKEAETNSVDENTVIKKSRKSKLYRE